MLYIHKYVHNTRTYIKKLYNQEMVTRHFASTTAGNQPTMTNKGAKFLSAVTMKLNAYAI